MEGSASEGEEETDNIISKAPEQSGLKSIMNEIIRNANKEKIDLNQY